MIKASGKKWSPTSAANVVKAVKAGNNAAAQALINAMANKAVKAAAAVGNALPDGMSKTNKWKAELANAGANIREKLGNAANNPVARVKLAAAKRTQNAATIAAAHNWVRAQLAARTAKKANKNARKAAKSANKTKKNVAAAPAAPGYNPFNNNSFANNVGPNAGPKGPNPFNEF